MLRTSVTCTMHRQFRCSSEKEQGIMPARECVNLKGSSDQEEKVGLQQADGNPNPSLELLLF